VMLSNSYTELARALYAGQPVHESIPASRKINCDGKKRGEVEELIVCSYEPGTEPAGPRARLALRETG
jgi:DNA adenine methylase